MMSRAELNGLVIALRGALRLEDWVIRLSADSEQDTAFTVIMREEKIATILYNEESITPFYIRHEVLHILFADMEFLASNGRGVDIMEMYNLLEERVCNTLADALDY